MTEMIFDRQQDAHIVFGYGTVNIPIYTKPGALRHKPSSRTQLICRWHRRVQGRLTCTWTEIPSMLHDGHDAQLPISLEPPLPDPDAPWSQAVGSNDRNTDTTRSRIGSWQQRWRPRSFAIPLAFETAAARTGCGAFYDN
jgi:hypothetical protein